MVLHRSDQSRLSSPLADKQNHARLIYQTGDVAVPKRTPPGINILENRELSGAPDRGPPLHVCLHWLIIYIFGRWTVECKEDSESAVAEVADPSEIGR